MIVYFTIFMVMDKDDILGSAYIGDIEEKLGSNGMYELSIPYHFPLGKNKSIREDSPLVKPFKHILLEGRPTKKIAFTFYAENGDYRIIGAFCYTHGKRILFFPGLILSRVKHSPDNREMLHEMHRIDHFSVEDNVINWHVTLEGKKAKNHKYPTLKTKMISKGIFLWFVMGIPNLQIMEPMPETQVYSK